MIQLNQEQIISVVQKITKRKNDYWVLFKNGTFVLIDYPKSKNPIELKHLAFNILSENALLLQRILTFCNDEVIFVDNIDGWVVPSPIQPGIFTFIHRSEFEEESPSELAVSVLGRTKCLRDYDMEQILYVNCPSTFSAC